MNKQEILTKHTKLADLAINHGYVPQGSHADVHELAELHKSESMGKVDMYCGDCIFKMFKRLYSDFDFNPAPVIVVENPKEPVREKITFPKHHKKRK